MTPTLGRILAALPGSISLAESLYAALALRHGEAVTDDEAKVLASVAHSRIRRAAKLKTAGKPDR